jgi:hypothetical protein
MSYTLSRVVIRLKLFDTCILAVCASIRFEAGELTLREDATQSGLRRTREIVALIN